GLAVKLRRNASRQLPVKRTKTPQFRLQGEHLEDRRLLSSTPNNPILWANASGGDWNVGSHWTGGIVPGSDDYAKVDVPGITVTHNSATSDGVAGLQITNASIILKVGAGSLTLGSGSSALGNTQVMNGATLNVASNAQVSIQPSAIVLDA